jgi:hypothetical protein
VEITRFKEWTCVALPGKGKINTDAVWIPSSRWVHERGSVTDAWTGVWQNEYAKISVTALDGELHMSGRAVWVGAFSEHFGEFDFEGTPVSDTFTGSHRSGSDRCEVFVRRVGPYLFAQDNRQCGAINVTFDGLYRFRGK